MAELGHYNSLEVLRETSSGFFLDGGEQGDILLPGRLAPRGLKEGDEIEVFLYFDSEDRIVATTEEPFCEVGDFAQLEVVEVNEVGAFLDWGLQKDLLVPFREQKVKMEPGSWHIVYIFIDEQSKRITASAKVDRFLNKAPSTYQINEEVELLIYGPCPMGYNAIVNGSHWGMLYDNEVFQPLNRGENIRGYINKVREDGKIDVRLYPAGYKKAESTSELIIEYMRRHDGFMTLTEKSPADLVYKTFGISKKNFKMAVGKLYKERAISLADDGITLVRDDKQNTSA